VSRSAAPAGAAGTGAPSSGPGARWTFAGIALMLFAAGAAATVACCMSMPAMAAWPMPGGWTLSMVWTPLCGRCWPAAMARFLGMWSVMTAAMMTPVVAPALWHCRQAAAAAGSAHPGRLAAQAGMAYALAWIACGLAVCPLGFALAAAEWHWPALARVVPFAAGGVVLAAGAGQFSKWKTRRLACCRHGPPVSADAITFRRHGLRLGLRCIGCCANLMAAWLAVGVMDLRAMAAATAAIALERLAPDGPRAARLVGIALAGTGLAMLQQAMGA
jgi:predicted metal-binding membrane protein